jgi:hypothetical protein
MESPKGMTRILWLCIRGYWAFGGRNEKLPAKIWKSIEVLSTVETALTMVSLKHWVFLSIITHSICMRNRLRNFSADNENDLSILKMYLIFVKVL